ncbi:MAG: phosphodiesterase [Clostridia bacterium]|nr:phosphodiesterase [Clostridia bacterium]
MKLFICSDIHGDIECAKAAVAAYKREDCEKMIILGDVLYHGPRNDLPSHYAPKEVIELLNGMKNEILAVRGNCDTEVDQMVLTFPILADYAVIWADGVCIYATHGHNYNTESLPPLSAHDVLLHGHTHVLTATPFGNNNYYLNPGSVTLPKNGNPKTYAIIENGIFTVKTLDGNEILSQDLKA